MVNHGLTVYGNKGSTDQHAPCPDCIRFATATFARLTSRQRRFCSSFWTALMISLSSSLRLWRGSTIRTAKRPPTPSSKRVVSDATHKPCQVETGITSSDYLLAFLVGTRRALTAAGRRTSWTAPTMRLPKLREPQITPATSAITYFFFLWA